MKSVIRRLTTVLCLASATATRAAEHAAENATLAVTYDDRARSFAVTEKATGNTFLTHGKLEGNDRQATVQVASDPVFGSGRKIVISQADGSTASLELYEGLPFLLVRKDLKNSGEVATDIQRLAPVSCVLDLDQPATTLRTMGTAGLTAPDKHPGSYLFLTLADPATRRGVVTGWLTQDRASGVMFSDINAGKVTVKARLDYGHLRIPVGKSAPLETLAIGIFDDARIGQELYADAIKKQYGIKLHPQVSGYCS